MKFGRSYPGRQSRHSRRIPSYSDKSTTAMAWGVLPALKGEPKNGLSVGTADIANVDFTLTLAGFCAL